MQERFLPTGKLDAALLGELLAGNRIDDPRVLLGPGIGRDAAVLDMGGGNCLIAKTDPITFATEKIGAYAVQVNANDVATLGARPKWFLATILLPENAATTETAGEIYADIVDACRKLEIELIGGHTEITGGLDRAIVVGQMLGEAQREELALPEKVRPGDAVLLTKGIAVEGTAILGRELAIPLAQVTELTFPRRCAAFLDKPGISVVWDARIACETGGVRAMHDPTEGGLATGLRELAVASGCGITVRRNAIPVYDETLRACEAFGLDPLGLIASGSLLIVAAPSYAGGIVKALDEAGIECAVIGEMGERGGPCRMLTGGAGERELPTFERDEIARLYAELDAKGE